MCSRYMFFPMYNVQFSHFLRKILPNDSISMPWSHHARSRHILAQRNTAAPCLIFILLFYLMSCLYICRRMWIVRSVCHVSQVHSACRRKTPHVSASATALSVSRQESHGHRYPHLFHYRIWSHKSPCWHYNPSNRLYVIFYYHIWLPCFDYHPIPYNVKLTTTLYCIIDYTLIAHLLIFLQV